MRTTPWSEESSLIVLIPLVGGARGGATWITTPITCKPLPIHAIYTTWKMEREIW